MTSPTPPPGFRVRYFLVSLLALSSAALTSAQQTTAPATPADASEDDEAIVLSPFTVDASKEQGYFAQNTLAGSRMRMNLSDLGSSISVVTKQQMEDTASVDINDVFRYELNTEGSATYTPSTQTFRSDGILDVNAGGTLGNQVASFTNATANRIRGIGAPSTAINYFPAIGQLPMDSYNVQSLEITRGPNSLIFGLGSPAGIVNQTTAQANFRREAGNVTLRFDDRGSYRGSFSFNKPIIRDRLAVYGAAVYDDRRFERKPSYDLTRRQYFAVAAKPFSKTTIRADVENYRNDNRRPNTLTPRDFVTQWNLAGQPVWDPLTRQVTLGNGQVASVNVVKAGSVNASQVRNFIMSRPGYDPTKWNAAQTTYNGISVFDAASLTNAGTFSPATNTPSNNPLFVPGITWNQNRATQQISGGELFNWFQPLYAYNYRSGWGTAADPTVVAPFIRTEAQILANSAWADIYNRGWTNSTGWTGINNGLGSYKYPGVTDKSVYDWESINVNEMNFGQEKNQNYHIEIEQELLDNLHLSGGWFRQDFRSKTNYTVAQLNVATLAIDTNKYMPDGTPNPLFGKPFVEDTDPDRYINESLDDHYRAMLAWTPDFTQKNGWLKWLGHHQALGMWSRDESVRTAVRQRFAFVDSPTFEGKVRYLPNQSDRLDGTPTGWNMQGSYRRLFYLAGPNDPNGIGTRSPGEWNTTDFSGNIRSYDYPTSSFTDVPVRTAFNTFDGSGRSQQINNSLSAALSSFLWNDRLVATWGVRRDEFKARGTNTGLAAVTEEDGTVLFPAITNADKWVNGVYQTDLLYNRWNRWQKIDGTTRTLGGVLRPFQKWDNIERRADAGSLAWEFVRDFGFSYNQSNNFNPPSGAFGDFFGTPLPKPSGEGKDYGVQFSLFDQKLFARVTWFEASNENEQFSGAATLQRLSGHIDTTAFRNWARTIAKINMGMNPTLPGFNDTLPQAVEDQVQAAAAVIWEQPYLYYDSLPYSTQNATRSADARGYEAEINYNPTRNWTMRFTFGRQDTKYSDVLREFDAWYGERNPIWQAAKASTFLKPEFAQFATYTSDGGRPVDLTNFWTSYGFTTDITLDNQNGWTNVENYYNAVVTPQVAVGRDLNGQSAPGQRKYRGAITTNYSFDEGRFKGFSVGGSQRWESKSVIGYLGRASGLNGSTVLDVSDVSKPVYDSDNSYTDLWFAYNRRIMNDKVRWKLQLNIANVFENGGLRAVGVNYDGSPYAFRIIDPRQFILTSSFDF